MGESRFPVGLGGHISAFGGDRAAGEVLARRVLAATPANSSRPPKLSSPTTGFYTLLDRVSLLGSQINNPQASTTSDGEPDVTFALSSKGASQFQAVTARIARRGEINSGLGPTLYQHFAVALDNQLITVPYINFNLYPDGIIGTSSDIQGSFTAASASSLATELRLGALPIGLHQISEEQISASLGKQALHQALTAGLAGLAIVALFLLSFYRVLGVIATTALIVYSIYFYALIKLIPITLTLAGVAGLILTIGVAADANIVIFERVKEEIRAGRSIRQSILAGYKRGLSAIIDANVVTIMTAFILFVLATSDVKGFAFTLGIGTLVSLFTAVLATQAILLTIGASRTLARPSALGVRPRKHAWRMDFMGASKYFFSLSACILLIGALAIGVRGLNLGIDFTSGTQVSVGLAHRASQAQVSSLMSSLGVRNATVEQVTGDKALGKYGFQIASNKLPQGGRQAVANALQQRFGIHGASLNYTSVGPSFGSTVAHSAVVAMIVSLLLISLYIALRFEWKFALPVLIALMHDLLITAGVYALTGRTVTADTVAALLTILGYSLYDTIIVFDRIRENIPRMPRAAFSEIVNRSMSEVLTRSLATTSCTLMPILALLLFGGSTLRDFAFALLVGVTSGAYSSIFIASPVLTRWKEREPAYRARRRRIAEGIGAVPAYATATTEPHPARARGDAG
jgi:SecD/SecF fusion protein